jgi:flagellar basal body-associated protein FliL
MAQQFGEPIEALEKPKNKMNPWLIVLIVILVMLLCCCVCALVMWFWLGDIIWNELKPLWESLYWLLEAV